MPPAVFPKITTSQVRIFVVTMDYIDKSDVEVFTLKLTLVMATLNKTLQLNSQ